MVQLLKQRHTVTEAEARYFMSQAIQGVHYLHNEGIIHRDVKLGNLFINHNMEIRIGDFGLAVRADKNGKKEMWGILVIIPLGFWFFFFIYALNNYNMDIKVHHLQNIKKHNK